MDYMDYFVLLMALVSYVSSALWYRNETIKYFSQFTYTKPEMFHVIMMFIPLINLLFAIFTAFDNIDGEKIARKLFSKTEKSMVKRIFG